MKNRSTVDIIALAVTFTVIIALLITTLTVGVVKITHPNSEITDLIDIERELLAVMLGAVVGFIGGRQSS